MTECIDDAKGPCKGDVTEGVSRSGATRSSRCERHWDAYDVRMDKLYADVQRRYPGWDTPGSPPPAWFDATYAGESWDDD